VRLRTAGLMFAAGLLVLSGCGSEDGSLDRPATERQVGRAVAKVVTPPVAATSCTGALPLEQGRTFTCQVKLGAGAGTLRASVLQTDDDGALEVEPLDAVLSDAQVARQLKASLNDQFGRSFQVDCGDEGQTVRRPGSTSSCTARDQTSRRKVAVTVEDASGSLSFEVQGEA
jgi:Domain of unknown function (DUF4333)